VDNPIQQKLRQLPAVGVILDSMPDEIAHWGHAQVAQAVRKQLSQLREEISLGGSPPMALENIKQSVVEGVASAHDATLVSVFNLTGIVLHSNLGRAQLCESAIRAVTDVASNASNLEFDLSSGKRGDREAHIEAMICEQTGAEAATAVNNNAAAVLLALNTLAMGQNVAVSRGELVEIGGSFRIPDIMNRAGCSLTEVGTTNRTHLKDYAEGVNANTALLMKVHTSNYRIEGYTTNPTESELARLASGLGIPFMIDLGSGNLLDFAALNLPKEPTVADALGQGADLVTFSGDKLLGGPQAGLIAGRADLIAQIKANPLKRALRLDKMTLAALAETLKLYNHPEKLRENLPTLRLLTRPLAAIEELATSLLPAFASTLGPQYSVSIEETLSQIGSGSLPVETLPSSALKMAPVSGADSDLRALSAAFRGLPRPVIGRIYQGALWFDLRCLENHQKIALTQQLSELAL
jgi:L-seryl-tRNA(Ser) seleniumtransferase